MQQARLLHASKAVLFAEEAATQGSIAKLNFSVPYKAIYINEPVHTVIVPGMVGEYGVTGEHQAVLSELKPGTVQIFKSDSGEPEKYFVSAGFTATHEDSSTDVSVAEAAKLEDLDVSIAQQKYSEYKQKADAAPEGSMEKAYAQIATETYEEICIALGVQVA